MNLKNYKKNDVSRKNTPKKLTYNYRANHRFLAVFSQLKKGAVYE